MDNDVSDSTENEGTSYPSLEAAVLAYTGTLDSLVAALLASGFSSPADLNIKTIFAPNNAAFDRLLAALDVQSVNEIPQDVLQEVSFDHTFTSVHAQNTGDSGFSAMSRAFDGDHHLAAAFLCCLVCLLVCLFS